MRPIDADELKKKAYPFPCAIGVEYAVTLRAIDETPTVDAETVRHGRWIPVAERLPPEEQYVLITQKERYPGQAKEGEFHPVVKACFSDNCWFMSDGEIYFYDEDVVYAWMPLPEPYEPDGAKMDGGVYDGTGS